MACRMFVLCLLAGFVTGCSKTPPSDQASAEQPAKQGTVAPDAPTGNGQPESGATSPVPPGEQRPTLAGRWFLVLSLPISRDEPRKDVYSAVLEIAESGGKLQGKLLATRGEGPQPKLQDVTLADKSTRFSVELFGTPWEFEGELRDGVVWGNALRFGQLVEPARLLPTEAATLEDHLEPKDGAGRESMTPPGRDEDRFTVFQKFAQQFPTSPLALDAYQQMLFEAKPQKHDAKHVDAVASDYFGVAAHWGERMVQMARLNTGFILAENRYLPQLALKYFDATEQALTEDSPSAWKDLLKVGRSKAEVALAVDNLESESAETRQQAAQQLENHLKDDVFNYLILYSLARHAEQQGDTDAALLRYAQLSALPQLAMVAQYRLAEGDPRSGPKIRETFERLWAEKHGGEEGLEEHLNDVYRKSIYSFASREAQPQPAKQGDRVVLVELFTGVQCPPCMAADVAIGGMETLYDKSDLIVLRFHEHAAGPDPLANPDGDDRMLNYYKAPGTPMAFVNGKLVEGVAGPLLEHVEDSFQRLRAAVEPQLGQDSELTIKLSAHGENGELTLSAEVEGLKDPAPDLRLRLVLAEDEIEFPASNGIRVHEMVVRSMPGGPGGIEPADGQLKFSETLDLAKFKQRQADYLKAFEENTAEVFRVKPMELKPLHLVAFVQDDSTKEVLQAAAIPVKGMLEYPELAAADGPSKTPAAGASKGVTTSDKPSAGPQLVAPQTNADPDGSD